MRILPLARRRFALVALLAAACANDSTAPIPSLVGTWDLVGYTYMGVAAVTNGTWVFQPDNTFNATGTVTMPGQPSTTLELQGSYVQTGNSAALTIAAQTGTWTLTATPGEVTLTAMEPPPAQTITLRRRT